MEPSLQLELVQTTVVLQLTVDGQLRCQWSYTEILYHHRHSVQQGKLHKQLPLQHDP